MEYEKKNMIFATMCKLIWLATHNSNNLSQIFIISFLRDVPDVAEEFLEQFENNHLCFSTGTTATVQQYVQINGC